MLKIHCGAHAVHFGLGESAGEDALEQAHVAIARGSASRWCALIAIGYELESLRSGLAEAGGGEAQHAVARRDFDDRADEVALVRPEMEHTSPMLSGEGVVRALHIEEDAAIFEQCGARMLGEEELECLRQLSRSDAGSVGRHCNDDRRRWRSLQVNCARTALCWGIGGLPAHALAQFGDVGGVVFAVPGVEGDDLLQRLAAIFRMRVAAGKVGVGERRQERGPALVDAVNHGEGRGEGRGTGVVQLSPSGFVIGVDGGPLLDERMAKARVGIHVAVGDVVHGLPHCPTAVAIGRVELRIVEAFDCFAEICGQVANGSDGGGTIFGSSGGSLKLAGGKAERFEYFSGHAKNLA